MTKFGRRNNWLGELNKEEQPKISELDDSRHAHKGKEKKKAQKKGEDAPTYRSGAAIPKSKRKEAKLKATEKDKKNDK
jgi:hypothetical protein